MKWIISEIIGHTNNQWICSDIEFKKFDKCYQNYYWVHTYALMLLTVLMKRKTKVRSNKNSFATLQ